MTTNGQLTAAPVAPATPAPPPRRQWRTRLASGHLLMIVAGLLTFVLVVSALRERGQTVPVAVAAHDIAPGAAVRPDDVRTVELSASSSLRAGLLAPAELASGARVATRRIAAGEPVVASALAGAAGPSGLRAMSVPVAAEHAVGGELAVGDQVDVIAADGAAEDVVRGAEVIAVAPRRGSAGLSASTGGQFYVTLAVDADTALRLAGAIRGGKLEVLRSTGAEPVPGGAG